MTILDIMSLFADWDEQKIRIEEYTDEDCFTRYEGSITDVPECFYYKEVVNIDNLTKDCVLCVAYYEDVDCLDYEEE